MRVNKA